jgi:hypothetical protein
LGPEDDEECAAEGEPVEVAVLDVSEFVSEDRSEGGGGSVEGGRGGDQRFGKYDCRAENSEGYWDIDVIGDEYFARDRMFV